MISTAPNKLETLKKHWKETALLPGLKKNPERQARFTTSSDDMEVDAIEQWPADARPIALDLRRRAPALTGRVAMEPAAAGVRRGHPATCRHVLKPISCPT